MNASLFQQKKKLYEPAHLNESMTCAELLVNNELLPSAKHFDRTTKVSRLPSKRDVNTRASVSVKTSVGTLCCRLALPILVHKIWRVDCDKHYSEDEETGQK